MQLFNDRTAIQAELAEACELGNLLIVKQCLLDGADATVAQNLAVRKAAEFGHLEILDWLVNDSGQLVDVTDDSQYALRRAAQNGHLEVVDWLIRKSNQRVDFSVENFVAVREAADSGQTEVALWFLMHGSRATAENAAWNGAQLPSVDAFRDDNEFFQLAVYQNQPKLVKYLVEELGCCQTADLDIYTELSHLAVSSGFFEITKILLSDASRNIDISANQNYLLRQAHANGFSDIVHWLLYDSAYSTRILATGNLDEIVPDGFLDAYAILEAERQHEWKYLLTSKICLHAAKHQLVCSRDEMLSMIGAATPESARSSRM